MLSIFLETHRDELVRRCTELVATRPARKATAQQLRNGIPLFLSQLQRTLEAEEAHLTGESLKISGPAGGDLPMVSEMGVSAGAHGKELLNLGYTVDQVVHDYGDLCQSITNMAVESNAPFAVSEFRTLNRCLDNGIASAVSAFTSEREASMTAALEANASARVEMLLHSLRSSLATATYALAAMEMGNLPMSGSTGNILKRSIEDIRQHVGGPALSDLRQGDVPPT